MTSEPEGLAGPHLPLNRWFSDDSGSALFSLSTSAMSWELSSSKIHSSRTTRQDTQPANSRGRWEMRDDSLASNVLGVCRKQEDGC